MLRQISLFQKINLPKTNGYSTISKQQDFRLVYFGSQVVFLSYQVTMQILE